MLWIKKTQNLAIVEIRLAPERIHITFNFIINRNYKYFMIFM